MLSHCRWLTGSSQQHTALVNSAKQSQISQVLEITPIRPKQICQDCAEGHMVWLAVLLVVRTANLVTCLLLAPQGAANCWSDARVIYPLTSAFEDVLHLPTSLTQPWRSRHAVPSPPPLTPLLIPSVETEADGAKIASNRMFTLSLSETWFKALLMCVYGQRPFVLLTPSPIHLKQLVNLKMKLRGSGQRCPNNTREVGVEGICGDHTVQNRKCNFLWTIIDVRYCFSNSLLS